MNLILQAIKAMFRKVEGAVSTLSGKISKVEIKADNAQKTANAAKTAAVNAQNTANAAKSNAATAQTTANAAKTAAANAQTTANTAKATADSKPSFVQDPTAIDITDIHNNAGVGELHKVDGISKLTFKGGDIVCVKLKVEVDSSTFRLNAVLLADSTAGAEGVIYTGDKVFCLHRGNGLTTGWLDLIRLV